MRAIPFLVALSLLLLAGCTAGPVANGTDTATDTSPSQTARLDTPTGACTAVTTPTVEAENYSTKPYPDVPENGSADAAGSYARSFERAYRFNDQVTDRTTYIEVYATVRNVTRYGDAYVVRLTAYTNGGVERQDGEGTPVEVHWDGAPEHVAYLVTDRRLVRSVGDSQVTPSLDTLADGTTLACY
jgi:hypothetical protein